MSVATLSLAGMGFLHQSLGTCLTVIAECTASDHCLTRRWPRIWRRPALGPAVLPLPRRSLLCLLPALQQHLIRLRALALYIDALPTLSRGDPWQDRDGRQ